MLDPTKIRQGDELWYSSDVNDPSRITLARVVQVHCDANNGYSFDIQRIAPNNNPNNTDETPPILQRTTVEFLTLTEWKEERVSLEEAGHSLGTSAFEHNHVAAPPVAIDASILRSVTPSFDSVHDNTEEHLNLRNASLDFINAPREETKNDDLHQSLPPNLQTKIPLPAGKEHIPKEALYTWCNQNQRISLCAENYVTWDDGGKDHVKRFTSIFIHPLTGELFPSGQIEAKLQVAALTDDPSVPPIVWYFTKKLAEHAAAGRAYDCLLFRHGLENGNAYQTFCQEPPSEETLPLPFVPDDAFLKIENAQTIAAARIS